MSLFNYTGNTISPLFFAKIAKYFGAAAAPRVYGYVILLATTLGYSLANFFYFKAGRLYKKEMEERDRLEAGLEGSSIVVN